jgi:hypothetical protein
MENAELLRLAKDCRKDARTAAYALKYITAVRRCLDDLSQPEVVELRDQCDNLMRSAQAFHKTRVDAQCAAEDAAGLGHLYQ